MNKQLQTVYIPIKEHSEFKILEGGIGLENCYPTETYVFLPEELKQLLEEYTNRIVENAKLGLYSDGVLREHVNGVMINREDYYGTVYVDNKSITSQLPKFLKEKGYE